MSIRVLPIRRSRAATPARAPLRCIALACAAALVALALPSHAAERITLANGFHLICDHRAVIKTASGSHVRLYVDSGSNNFIEVSPSQIVSAEPVAIPAAQPADAQSANAAQRLNPAPQLNPTELHQLLARAGQAHDLDVDLLASVVREESAGHPRAVSRAGAQGLMQLMPSTAARLGVTNTFAPGQNIRGGAAYLDSLLHRYHDNLALALAAYNAGPGAVDRWHGIPPYRETQLYVARVIHEFNRRIAARSVRHLTQVASAVH